MPWNRNAAGRRRVGEGGGERHCCDGLIEQRDWIRCNDDDRTNFATTARPFRKNPENVALTEFD